MSDPSEYADDQYAQYLYDLDMIERANTELNTIAAQQQES